MILPGRHVGGALRDLFAGRKTLAEYEAQAAARVDPVTDDRPFFFARSKPWGLPRGHAPGFRRRSSLPLLLALRGLRGAGQAEGRLARPYAASVLYFAGLGVGFIAVELALLQHLTLLLGHPDLHAVHPALHPAAAGGLGSS